MSLHYKFPTQVLLCYISRKWVKMGVGDLDPRVIWPSLALKRLSLAKSQGWARISKVLKGKLPCHDCLVRWQAVVSGLSTCAVCWKIFSRSHSLSVAASLKDVKDSPRHLLCHSFHFQNTGHSHI